MFELSYYYNHPVNCRIGSLENQVPVGSGKYLVNCRIGSLEITPRAIVRHHNVNCRIGSLEKHSFSNFG